jgi:hypothetical protein
MQNYINRELLLHMLLLIILLKHYSLLGLWLPGQSSSVPSGL